MQENLFKELVCFWVEVVQVLVHFLGKVHYRSISSCFCHPTGLLLASAHVPEGKSTPPYASACHFLLGSRECLDLFVDLENVAFICACFLHDVHIDDESWLRLGVLL